MYIKEEEEDKTAKAKNCLKRFSKSYLGSPRIRGYKNIGFYVK